MDAPWLRAHIRNMTRERSPFEARDKVVETKAPAEDGHAAWKRAKVERGLAQAEVRDAMIPVERILRDFKLDG